MQSFIIRPIEWDWKPRYCIYESLFFEVALLVDMAMDAKLYVNAKIAQLVTMWQARASAVMAGMGPTVTHVGIATQETSNRIEMNKCGIFKR